MTSSPDDPKAIAIRLLGLFHYWHGNARAA
jgi:hypothetical protein